MNLNSINIDKLVNQGLQKACLRIETDAKLNAPVDTGTLRASIGSEVSNLQGVVGTNIEYAGFVELGTSRHKPQPFLYPAYAKNKQKILSDIKNSIKGGIR